MVWGDANSSAIHNLSHRLRPSHLDVLRPVASIQRLCGEFSDRHKLQVKFVHYRVPEQIPKVVTLFLDRSTQEALRNVAEHSGVAEAEVELSSYDHRIKLYISDAGVGFSPDSAKRTSGLGLICMQERLRSVGGQPSVQSELSQWTRIRVRIPQWSSDD